MIRTIATPDAEYALPVTYRRIALLCGASTRDEHDRALGTPARGREVVRDELATVGEKNVCRKQRIAVTSPAKTCDADRVADLEHLRAQASAQKLRCTSSVDHPIDLPPLVVRRRDDQLRVWISPGDAADLPGDRGHIVTIEMQIRRMMRGGSCREGQCDDKRARTTHNNSPTDVALAAIIEITANDFKAISRATTASAAPG